MAAVELKNVSFHYPDSPRAVLSDLSLSVEIGEVVELKGRNGAGKTTLLKLVAGELNPTGGFITRRKGLRGVYLDQFAGEMLAHGLTVRDHLVAFQDFNRTHGPRFPETIDAMVDRLLKPFDVGLEGRLTSFSGQLSGGQRQILALATVLLSGVQVLCLDEFASNLDDRSTRCAIDNLVEWTTVRCGVIFFASHSPIFPTTSKTIAI